MQLYGLIIRNTKLFSNACGKLVPGGARVCIVAIKSRNEDDSVNAGVLELEHDRHLLLRHGFQVHEAFEFWSNCINLWW